MRLLDHNLYKYEPRRVIRYLVQTINRIRYTLIVINHGQEAAQLLRNSGESNEAGYDNQG